MKRVVNPLVMPFICIGSERTVSHSVLGSRVGVMSRCADDYD